MVNKERLCRTITASQSQSGAITIDLWEINYTFSSYYKLVYTFESSGKLEAKSEFLDELYIPPGNFKAHMDGKLNASEITDAITEMRGGLDFSDK